MYLRGNQNRFIICGALLTGLLTVLSYRVTSLQYLERNKHESLVKRASHYTKEVFPAHRGLIVDCNEEPLVVNIPLTDIYIDKYHLEDINTISWGIAYKRLRYTPQWNQNENGVRRKMLSNKRFKIVNHELSSKLILEHNSYIVSLLAKPLKMQKKDLLDLLNNSKKKKLYLRKNMNEADANYIKRILRKNYIRGVYLEKRLTRHYPSPMMATHLIGYTSDYKGRTGLEARYDSTLRGVDGYHKRKSSPNKLSIASDEEEFKLPVQGFNIKLTIDTSIQSIAEEELDKGLKAANCRKGCIVVMDPSSGDILAMAGRPHYNLNTKKGIAQGSRNYIFNVALEPGSTFKVITAAAALNEGLLNIHRPLIDCENGYYKDRSVVLRDDYPRDQLSLAQILAKSSNIGSYKIGRQVGRDVFFEYVKRFGFGKPTALLWKGEVRTKGTIGPSPQEFASATYGYAISATPMHMAIAYATIANDGVMMRPTLVKSVIANDGKVIEEYSPKAIKQVIQKKVAKSLRRAMLTVSEEGGTGKLSRVSGYSVAGKTGTTRKWEKGGYVKGRYICSYGGMIPAEDPVLVIYVVVDDPLTTTKKRYGGVLAAPIFSDTALRVIKYLKLNARVTSSL